VSIRTGETVDNRTFSRAVEIAEAAVVRCWPRSPRICTPSGTGSGNASRARIYRVRVDVLANSGRLSMPVVLAPGAPTASGHTYNDVLGKQYEFPLQYRTLVTPGESFVYYRGRRGSEIGRPVYFGTGVVGTVTESTRSGQLVAEVHDVELFDEPIPAKALDGTYLETGIERGINWTSGVRRISDEAMARIVGGIKEPAALATGPARPGRAFASPQHASALERYSVKVALELLSLEFCESAVREMPPCNPGFDTLMPLIEIPQRCLSKFLTLGGCQRSG
jgi:hypothetical protein